MPYFDYSGRDSSGALVSGRLDAGTEDEAASRLFNQRVTPIEIRESRDKGVKKGDRSSRSQAQDGSSGSTMDNLRNFLTQKKVENDELIIFSRQMFSLTKAGLPLDKAIKGLEASMANPTFRAVLRDMVQSLENGMTLASALDRHPKIFPTLLVSMVHVGENTGRLDLAFHEISKYLELEKNTAKQVKSATRYPLFVILAMGVALAVLTVFVIPVFADTFDRLGAELPWQTVALISTSSFVVDYWMFIVAAVGGGVFAFLSWLKTTPGRLSWDKRKLSIPLAGAVFERVALGRFARTFAIVMQAGMPIVQGLTVVAGAVGNAYIASNVMRMREGVERGESLHRTAVNCNMFSPLVLQMISVGEETGTVDDLLIEVADFYDAEVEYDLKRLSDAIEPILISFMAVLVLILALGVFLPIWDLNTAANG